MANQIIVSEDRNQITVVEGETRIVEVVTQGPQGPIGPSGPQGPSGSSILNQITSGSVTASVDIGSNVFRISSGAQPYLGLTYENSGVMRHQNSTPPYFTIFNNNGGVNMTPGAIGFIEIAGQRGGGGGTMVRFSGTYIGDGNSRNARLSIGTAQGTGFGGNQISIFKLSSGSFTNQPITIIGTGVDSYSTSSIDITGSYASRATTIINGGTGNSIVSFDYNGVPQTVLFPNGNWGINTFADGGQKLQVTGTTRLAGDATITGSLTVTGNITAQTLVVQTITSSVSFITGSTKFGSLSTNTHEFTGSVFVSGSATFGGSTGLYWDNANSRLGIGTNAPTNAINIVNGRLDISGTSTVAGSGISMGYLTGIYAWIQSWVSRPLALNPSGNNVTIGVSGGADSGHRFQVYGTTFLSGSVTGSDMLIRGSGNTSSTMALTVQNSSSQNILRVLNNGEFRIGNAGNFIWAWTYSSVYDTPDINGTNFSIYPTSGNVSIGGGTQAQTSGVNSNLITKGRYQPTSGTGTFADIRCEPLINQTGGANGITRGLYVNPTLIAAADWRSIEWSNNASATSGSWGLYGAGSAPNYLSGSLNIGTTTLGSNILNVSGSTLLRNGGGGTILRVQNSAGSDALIISNNLLVDVQQDLQLNNTVIYWNGSTQIRNTSNGILRFSDSTGANFTRLQFGGTTSAFPGIQRVSGSLAIVGADGSTTSSLLIGQTTDDGINRLQVVGSTFLNGSVTGSDMLIRGSGNTSATNAFIVQNSSAAQALSINNAGQAMFGTNAPAAGIKLETDGAFRAWSRVEIGQFGALTINTTQITKGASGSDLFEIANSSAHNAIAGTYYALQVRNSVNPTSGNAVVNGLVLNLTINQTGGANGITRGLYVNPTLTANADFRAIEWSNNAVTAPSASWGLYGAGTAPNLLNGRLYIPAGSYDLPSLSFIGDTNTGLFSPLADNLELKTGTNNAIILENQGINLIEYSENLGAFPTNFQQISVSIPFNVAAPDGTLTANIAVPDTSLNQHRFYRIYSTAFPFTTSVYAKAAGYNFISLGWSGGVNGEAIIFDLVNGTISGTASNHIAQIENVGNGWFRCSLTFTAAAAPGSYSRWIIVRNANSTANYSGDGTSGVYVWGWQMEENTVSTSYIRTGATAVTRPQAISLLGQNLYGNAITRRITGPSLTDLSFATSFTDRMTIHATTGNVMINSSTDLGNRLQVYGTTFLSGSVTGSDMLIRGSGNTSATNGLTIVNSAGSNLLTARNDGLTIANQLLSSTGTTSDGTLIVGGASTRYTTNTGINTNAIYTSAVNLTGDVLGAHVSGAGVANLYIYMQSNGYIGTRGALRLGAANGTDTITSVTNTWLSIAAGTTTRSQINLAASTAPTTPNNGDIWFDGTDIKMRIGGVTKTFTLV